MPGYLEIINSEKFEDIYKIFIENKKSFGIKEGGQSYTSEIAKKEFDVSQHSVMVNDHENRPDKKIFKPDIDSTTGEPRMDESTGKPKVTPGTTKVNRVPASFQEIIVGRRNAFLLGNPIKYDATYDEANAKQKALVDYIYEIDDTTKMLYKNKEVARKLMSEMEVAELWYLTEVTETGFWAGIAQKIGVKKPKLQLKVKIFSPWDGDKLYPLYDAYGDMIAFAREYKLREDSKDVDHFDVYTAEITYKYARRENGWEIDTTAKSKSLDGTVISGGKLINSAKKIPIIYYRQDRPEWANVQKMIDRIEKLLSNHGDMNDYFGEPILAIFGELIQAINKGDSGKILQLSENAKASFLALDSPPESIKMEIENLERFIFALSQTPNISFSEMKSLGDLSGVALELMFMDAHLAVMAKEEIFGMGVQRRINLIKAFIGNVLDFSLAEASQVVRMNPIFTPYMPKNMKEMIEMIGSAVYSEVLSKKTATEKLEDEGFIADAAQEQDRLREQASEDLSAPTV